MHLTAAMPLLAMSTLRIVRLPSFAATKSSTLSNVGFPVSPRGRLTAAACICLDRKGAGGRSFRHATSNHALRLQGSAPCGPQSLPHPHPVSAHTAFFLRTLQSSLVFCVCACERVRVLVRETARHLPPSGMNVAEWEDHSFVASVAGALERLSSSMVKQAQLLTLLQSSRDSVLEELQDTRRSLEVARSQLRAARSREAHALAETSILRRELAKAANSEQLELPRSHAPLARHISRPISPLRASESCAGHPSAVPWLPAPSRPTSAQRLRSQAAQRFSQPSGALRMSMPAALSHSALKTSSQLSTSSRQPMGQPRRGLSHLQRMQLRHGMAPHPSAAAVAATVSTGFGRARPKTAGSRG